MELLRLYSEDLSVIPAHLNTETDQDNFEVTYSWLSFLSLLPRGTKDPNELLLPHPFCAMCLISSLLVSSSSISLTNYLPDYFGGFTLEFVD